MKKENVYVTMLDVRNIIGTSKDGQPKRVRLFGNIDRHTGRRLFGLIPLPDRYAWTIDAVEIVTTKNGDEHRELREKELTFESRKRLKEELLDMEKALRRKCKEYRRIYGTRG